MGTAKLPDLKGVFIHRQPEGLLDSSFQEYNILRGGG